MIFLQGKEHSYILKGNDVKKYDHKVILWNSKVYSRGYTITHYLTDNDNSKQQSHKTITKYFSSKQEVRLVDLNISKFTILKGAVPYLTTLRKLYLQNNQLKTIPESLFHLTKLEDLHLQCNELTSLSPNIGLLVSLCVLIIFSNKIEEIPSQIREFIGNILLDRGQHFFCCQKNDSKRKRRKCIFKFLTNDILNRIQLSHEIKPKTCTYCNVPLFHSAITFHDVDEICGTRVPIIYQLCSYTCKNLVMKNKEKKITLKS
ncbi:2884_t:CDS:2 [Diversispora eburnea]|uniref:2884_t:CDS:1 n=1 Tax=Diversispora eburnea TaxID=1213867 RepID=A0A9N8VJ57_9GLOM|nr:2884_t:CDS:2 [Diversispora eburnea]